MKLALVLLFVAAASAFPAVEEFQAKNALDELVTQALEYDRWLLKRHEPYEFPPLPEQQLVDDDANLKFTTNNVKLSKASDFTIDKVSNNVPKLQSSFGVTVPAAHLEGNYKVSGTAFNKKVEGSGTFSADILNYKQIGDIQFVIIADHSLQIQDITLDFDVQGVQFAIDGLTIEGKTQEEIQEFLNKHLMSYLQDNKATINKKSAEQTKEVANKLMKGKSLKDVLDELKQLVASTPDPPPFPFQN